MSANQFLSFATGDGANTLTAAQYAALGAIAQGFQSGTASSQQFNTFARQVSTVIAALAQFTADNQSADVLDDGVVANFESKFGAALKGFLAASSVHYGVATGTGDAMVVTPTPAMLPVSGVYQAGTLLIVKTPSSANTSTSPTINASSIGNVAITKAGGGAVAAGDLPGNTWIGIFFDGTAARIQGLAPSDIASSAVVNQIITNNPSISPPVNYVEFTTAGPWTWTVPANVTYVDYEGIGGGGGGASNGAGNSKAGGGGGSAGTTRGRMAVTPGQVLSGVVGAAGVGSAANADGNGTTGGTTTITSLIYATGGEGGFVGTSSCRGGGPGMGVGGQENIPGGNGGDGNPTADTYQGGQGAPSSQGGGGRSSTINPFTVGGVNQVDGSAYGSGGGGIYFGAAGSAGGNGKVGRVKFYF